MVCAGSEIECLGGNCEAQCGYFDLWDASESIGQAEIMVVESTNSVLDWYTDGVLVLPTQGLTITASLVNVSAGFLLSLSQFAPSSLTYCTLPPALPLSESIESNNPEWWTADLRSVRINNHSVPIKSTAVLFNSTGSDIQMPPEDYISILKALLGGREEGEVWRSCVEVGDLPNITLEIGQWCFDVPAESYFGTGVQEGGCRLLISPGNWSDPIQSPLYWSLGYSFLWNYEIFFNNKEKSISLTGAYKCPSHSENWSMPPWAIVVIVIGGVLGLAGAIVGLVLYIRKRKRLVILPEDVLSDQVLDFTSSFPSP